jgi:hypothetical protein
MMDHEKAWRTMGGKRPKIEPRPSKTMRRHPESWGFTYAKIQSSGSVAMERRTLEPQLSNLGGIAVRGLGANSHLSIESSPAIPALTLLRQGRAILDWKKSRSISAVAAREAQYDIEEDASEFSLTPEGSRLFFEMMSRPNPAAVKSIQRGLEILTKEQRAKLGKERVRFTVMVRPKRSREN